MVYQANKASHWMITIIHQYVIKSIKSYLDANRPEEELDSGNCSRLICIYHKLLRNNEEYTFGAVLMWYKAYQKKRTNMAFIESALDSPGHLNLKTNRLNSSNEFAVWFSSKSLQIRNFHLCTSSVRVYNYNMSCIRGNVLINFIRSDLDSRNMCIFIVFGRN